MSQDDQRLAKGSPPTRSERAGSSATRNEGHPGAFKRTEDRLHIESGTTSELVVDDE